ncbi:MAG: tyramine oxidase [Candidatus Rokuibacteriota bacterium]|nr:MAG: tyramine oxidase [Candidatus Rokubacteria bacterium]
MSLGTTAIEANVASVAAHPLDPLTSEEIASAVGILRGSGKIGSTARFVTVTLHEPSKDLVLGYRDGQSIDREAFIVMLDNADGATYEAVVSLGRGVVTAWRHIPGVQPSIMLDEFFECENALKADPAFQEALRKRGITDYSLLMVDPWSAGNYGEEVEQRLRLARALTWVRSEPGDNGYAHPVEGLLALVDLNRMKVVSIEDNGVITVPPHPGNYSSRYIKDFRQDSRPLQIVQPEGPAFTVRGQEVQWQKWRFRIGFTPREGLILYTIGYEDQGRVRPIIYRASLVDMVVPYGDPHPNHRRKNAFDVGEYGIGVLANSLELGCDCLGEIRYFDACLADSRGQVVRLKNAVCMHEEDYGILWKHIDWRTNETEVRRSRRLVVSFIATVGNYEYGFYWYFYQDGTLEFQIKLTGILNTGALPAGETRKYGTLVAPQLYAPNHQHFFSLRLDMMVDGMANSVYEVHTEAEPLGPDNPLGNAFYEKATLLRRETEAQQLVDPLRGRYWRIVNTSVRNSLGEPVAYKLVPGDNIMPFAHETASVSRRATFITRHMWVTPYSPAERYAAGDYPNQHPGGAGLPEWTRAERSIENTDIVLWYTIGHHHIPRPEEWPVMPVSYIGLSLKPSGFFDRNPALDVPPARPDHCRPGDGGR